MYTVKLRIDGTHAEVIKTDSVEIIDGVLHVGDRVFEITNRLCMEVREYED